MPHIHDTGDLTGVTPKGRHIKNLQYGREKITGRVKVRYINVIPTSGTDDATYGIKIPHQHINLIVFGKEQSGTVAHTHHGTAPGSNTMHTCFF